MTEDYQLDNFFFFLNSGTWLYMTLFLVSAGSDFVCWGRREIERKITAKKGSSKNKMEKKKQGEVTNLERVPQ